MKMYFKYCDHEKNGSKLLLLVDKEMTNCPVSHQFLCVPVALKHQVEDFPIPMKETSSKALILGKMGTEPSQGGLGVGSKGRHKCPSTFTIPKEALTLLVYVQR